jgi:DNA repair exonuclease SbcCD nuclease subunit
LHAVPCRSIAGKSDLAQMIPTRAEGDTRIRVGMIHGQTFDIPGCQTNFPIAPDSAALRGLDYLAIGDTHAFREVVPGARYPVVYPSAPEPTKFGETDAGYVALVFFPRGRRRPIIRPERVARFRWVERVCPSIEALRALAEEDLRCTVMRLVLQMRLSAPEYDEAEQILRALVGTEVAPGRVGVMQIDRSELELDTGDIDEAFEDLPEVLRGAVARLRQAEQGEAADRAKRALYHLYRLVKEVG